jgi:hypothetical protein
MPDLSDIQNEQAKALITKYFTEVKPNIDTLRAQIPGGRIVRSADGTINVTPEFAQKWSLAQSEFIKLQQDITNLDGHTYNISYSLSLSQAHVKLFINDKLVTETDTTDSKSVNFRLFASDSFQKYISPENLQGLYILRSGVNHLRVEYTMTPKPVEVSEGSEITNEITPFSLTLNGSTKSYSGSVTPTASDIKDILVLQEKPITITNGVPKTTEGSLSADFTLE